MLQDRASIKRMEAPLAYWKYNNVQFYLLWYFLLLVSLIAHNNEPNKYESDYSYTAEYSDDSITGYATFIRIISAVVPTITHQPFRYALRIYTLKLSISAGS